MIDFSSLLEDKSDAMQISPKEIFESSIRTERFSYLRGDQQKILDDWFSQRTKKDTIIKMNTGAGKTTVGLLQLQSSLNEGHGPALYLCLNNQLVDQVVADATELGISSVTFHPGDTTIPSEFLNGQAILVTNIQKLFNAKSVFGIQGGNRYPIQVGSIVVDDAHAAVTKARDVFTLKFPSTHKIYTQLVNMFSESLKNQSLGTASDILDGKDRFSTLMVPYWTWQERLHEVIEILSQYSEVGEDDELKFKWAIVRDHLLHYFVIVSSDRIEIMPKCVPIQKIPAFFGAKRRIYMSATLNDDSVLIRDFQVAKSSVLQPLCAVTQSDVGEKMILAPFNLDRSLGQDVISGIMANAKKYNVVVLVGADRKAQYWVDKGFEKPNKTNIKQVLEQLESTKGRHVVLSNRYDGIDLPGDMCRILIIDDLPTANSLFDQYSMYARPSSKILRIAQAQKIEQGLGRAVRSVNDYCVILLCGRDLISVISTREFQDLMSPQTVEQIKLGNSIIDLMKKEHAEPQTVLAATMMKVLKRDEGWMRLHKQTITRATREVKHNYLIEYADAERIAFDLACGGRNEQAGDIIVQVLNDIKRLEQTDKGWYLQLASSYYYSTNRTKAMDVQLSAHSNNTFLLRPPEGVRYQKLTRKETQQATKILEFIGGFLEWNGLIMYVNNILDKLIFMENSSQSFEKAMKEIGECIGFETQQPEKEYGKGSDVLWNLYDDHYLIIEAKNEVLLTRTEIYKGEAEQLSNSMNWFAEEYVGKTGTPVLVHPCVRTNREAYPPAGTLVLQPEGLSQLCTNIRNFYGCLAQQAIGDWTSVKIATELRKYSLDRGSIKMYMKDTK